MILFKQSNGCVEFADPAVGKLEQNGRTKAKNVQQHVINGKVSG